MDTCYVLLRDSTDEGIGIISIYDTEENANTRLKEYMKEYGCRNGTDVSYYVTAYRINTIKEII